MLITSVISGGPSLACKMCCPRSSSNFSTAEVIPWPVRAALLPEAVFSLHAISVSEMRMDAQTACTCAVNYVAGTHSNDCACVKDLIHSQLLREIKRILKFLYFGR